MRLDGWLQAPRSRTRTLTQSVLDIMVTRVVVVLNLTNELTVQKYNKIKAK